jgi:hypothetical protein
MANTLNIDLEQPLTEEELMLDETSIEAEKLAGEAKAKQELAEAELKKNKGKEAVEEKTEVEENPLTLAELTAEETDEPAEPGEQKPAGQKTTPVAEEQKVTAIKAVASYFKEEGVLSSLDLENFDGTPESLIKAMQNEMGEGIEEYKNTRHPLLKKLMEADEAGVPIEQLLDIKAQEVKYNSIEDDKLTDNVGLQKELYKSYLKETTKFSEAKISKMIEGAHDDLTLESLVKEEALPELKKIQEQKEQELTRITKAQQEQARIGNEKLLNDYKTLVDKTEEIFPGIKVSKAEKADIFRMSTTPIANDGYGNPVLYAEAVYKKDPLKYNLVLNYLLNKTKGFEDLSTIMNVAKSTAAKELEKNILKSGVKKPVAQDNFSQEDDNKDALDVFYKNFPALRK